MYAHIAGRYKPYVRDIFNIACCKTGLASRRAMQAANVVLFNDVLLHSPTTWLHWGKVFVDAFCYQQHEEDADLADDVFREWPETLHELQIF